MVSRLGHVRLKLGQWWWLRLGLGQRGSGKFEVRGGGERDVGVAVGSREGIEFLGYGGEDGCGLSIG